ncbi:hypothetical protein WS67_20960 [Burkholderia singularis]|uniref:Uncharacterized protein n=1 Tax=Burkholderia singularis TaxID=1503053 RepID=A0A103DXK1_9BURK|nr:hypothetical protein WS67_20960 [Burkholderia singularis]
MIAAGGAQYPGVPSSNAARRTRHFRAYSAVYSAHMDRPRTKRSRVNSGSRNGAGPAIRQARPHRIPSSSSRLLVIYTAYLAFSAVFEMAWPPFEMSWPTPAIVLQPASAAVKINSAAAITRFIRFLLINAVASTSARY